ncbi:MAG: TetR family transcriptional regulator [Microbacterium sp. 71-36]|uniref:TetR/AcrR family transcriptional regulator n=1 Tax=unclassified Microbacterium TaxID=2609290 RepID=UPI00086AAA7B|nr:MULTISPECIES: TetR/AcrR family transcriptional regulator [unclassified Microbacterium]MBN9212590.1 TetR family transcriptional regulator [Microbacterium sp.]ODT39349.1 MAG: TetR family transcriptional regulator [Microbacterium sp. SCN 71-17]OJV76920.1 MAG: TetR family transcriptional regulator [Microbacterium sp. 71-36]
MPEVRRDAERTRAELLAVATEVFAEDGYSGARVDEIAARTRTTKRMIYYYFGGKEGLYRAVLEEAYRGIREAERGIDVDHSDPVQAVRALAEVTFDHHVQHDAFIRLVAIENIHRGEFIRQIDGLREASKPAKDVLDEILQRGRAAGLFRDDVEAIDVHLVISAYCVFQVANRYTFGHLFDVDLAAPARRAHLRSVIGDVVVGWLTSPAA